MCGLARRASICAAGNRLRRQGSEALDGAHAALSRHLKALFVVADVGQVSHMEPRDPGICLQHAVHVGIGIPAGEPADCTAMGFVKYLSHADFHTSFSYGFTGLGSSKGFD